MPISRNNFCNMLWNISIIQISWLTARFNSNGYKWKGFFNCFSFFVFVFVCLFFFFFFGVFCLFVCFLFLRHTVVLCIWISTGTAQNWLESCLDVYCSNPRIKHKNEQDNAEKWSPQVGLDNGRYINSSASSATKVQSLLHITSSLSSYKRVTISSTLCTLWKRVEKQDWSKAP